MTRPIVLAMTGASGAAYGVRLLQELLRADRSVHLVISDSGETVLQQELGIRLQGSSLDTLLKFGWKGSSKWRGFTEAECEVARQRLHRHAVHDFMAPIASGSYRTDGMILCPCSGTTLSGIVHAQGKDLIQRAAEVHLKEHRKLLLVPRETPLSLFQLENMHRAAQAGAIVLPAMPGWYHGVECVVDLIDFVVGRILDHFDIEHRLMRRWGSEADAFGATSAEEASS